MRLRMMSAVGCLLVIGSAVTGGVEGPISNLNASDADVGDQFGISLAMSGTLALVGAHNDNDGGNNSGSVYVYDLSNAALPVEVDKMTASDAAALDQFGWSVAIDGSLAVVGAINDQDNGSSSGSAYVFDVSTPGNAVEQSKLLASDGAMSDQFGSTVAISGSLALVGSPGAGDTGRVYVYDLTNPGSPIEASIIASSDADINDDFGHAIAIEGSIAVIGAHRNDDDGSSSGSAYIFDLSDPMNPVELSKLTASDGSMGGLFGESISMSGSTALIGAFGDGENGVGAGAAYAFDISDPMNPIERAKLLASDGESGDGFACDVGISGSIGIVGSQSDDDKGFSSGSAYLFDLSDPSNPTELSKLLASNGATGAFMGEKVAVDGAIAMAGAFQSGAAASNGGSAYVFASVDEGIGCDADANGDGVIDVNDVSYVLFRLGTVCP